MSEDINQHKKSLRQQLRRKRKALSKEYRELASAKILEHLVKSREYLLASTIFIYVGQEDEVNTSLIIKDALAKGKRVAVPVIISPGLMEACELEAFEDLEPNRFGILEPKQCLYRVDPKSIDVAYIPCLAFTQDGHRLGHGGGYYDRYLTQGHFNRTLIAFSQMEVEIVPLDSHDQQVQEIVTENGIRKIF